MTLLVQRERLCVVSASVVVVLRRFAPS